jgi:hypothetical protein
MNTNATSNLVRVTAAAGLCALSIGCAPSANGPAPVFACAEGLCAGDDAQKLKQGKQRIVELMTAFDETNFNGVYLTNRGVCGKVTGTTSVGGTPPPRFFYVTSEAAVIEPQTRDNGGERQEFIDALNFACST